MDVHYLLLTQTWYTAVAKQFTEKWMHPTPQKPTVVNVRTFCLGRNDCL
jgi:hypothetical protein